MENMQFCHSCGIPMQGPMAGHPDSNYCANCADETGTLKSREAVKEGISQWLGAITPGLAPEICLNRAEHYLQAMPAWAVN